jgi:hypothetical protein
MSKKKNTLRDLDDFLKQQAATLVQPTALEQPEPVATPPAVSSVIKTFDAQEQVAQQLLSIDKIIQDIKQLGVLQAKDYRHQLYDLVLTSLETQPTTTPEDKMLINTILFLKSGDQWKDVIREYWKNK